VDVAARFGGEEFAILLPSTPKLAALKLAEKLRHAVEKAGLGRDEQGRGKPLSVSVGVAIMRESLDASLHSAHQLQAAVSIPVLAAIPTILLEADLAALRRGRIRASLGAAALICLALVGGAANYVWVNGAPHFGTSTESTTQGPVASEPAPVQSPKDVGAAGE